MYSTILAALDGSDHSVAGCSIALELAQTLGSALLGAHVYDTRIHSTRFREMEPNLPERYKEEKRLSGLRDAHNSLIFEGFSSLSKGYMDDFVKQAREVGVPIRQIHREGRNYIELLRMAEEEKADLMVLGASGLGKDESGFPGSTAARVLRFSKCDTYIARKSPAEGGVLAGIDGSAEAFAALRKAVFWARALQKPLQIAAVFDPFFHNQVFKAMAHSLSPKRRKEVNLTKQEALHEELIDDGLGKLYEGFLLQAQELCRKMGMEAETHLLKGKAYRALVNHAQETDVDLIVVGRQGHHREDLVNIGSNSEAVARLAHCNVLITGIFDSAQHTEDQNASAMEWDKEALDRLQRIPPFARDMARKGIEAHVRSKGGSRVTLEEFQELARQMGMGQSPEPENE